jgi:2-dehydropantoate 2-reductase
MEKQKNIAVIGLGGVGSYFGGKLANNTNRKYNVQFLAKGEHLKAIQSNGLVVQNLKINTKFVSKPDMATDDISKIPTPDVVIIAVKSYDLDFVVTQLSEIITDNTIILPLINGIDIYDRVRSKLSKGIVLPSCAYVNSYIHKPGIINQTENEGWVIIGRDPQNKSIGLQELSTIFSDSDINHKIMDNPSSEIWGKYMFNAAYSLVTACYNKTVAEVFLDYDLKEITRKVMLEIYHIGIAKGVVFHNNIIEDSINRARIYPYDMKTSYQIDIENNEKQNEGDLYAGTILRLSAETRIPTPVTEELYNKVKSGTSKKACFA